LEMGSGQPFTLLSYQGLSIAFVGLGKLPAVKMGEEYSAAIVFRQY